MKHLTESSRAACDRLLRKGVGAATRERFLERVGVGIDNGMSESDAELHARAELSMPGVPMEGVARTCELVDGARDLFKGGELLGAFARPKDKDGAPVPLISLAPYIDSIITQHERRKSHDEREDEQTLEHLERAHRAEQRAKSNTSGGGGRVTWSKPPVIGAGGGAA